MREDFYWGIGNPDVLTATDPEDAIEEHLDLIFEEFTEGRIQPGSSHEMVIVEEYKFTPISKSFCQGRMLEYLLEGLDENYGNPEEYTAPTPAMVKAEEEFLESVISEFTPWRMEPTGKVMIVNIREWMEQK